MPATKPTRFLGLAVLVIATILVFGRTGVSAQATDQAKLEQGARLFADNCAVCHGENGQGRVGATLAKDWPSIRPDLTVKTIIENGIPNSVMPAWSQARGGPFSEQEIDALVYYILSWQTGGPPAITPGPTLTPRPPITPVANVVGDPNHGGILFEQNCAVCHGPHGEGRVGATLAKSWAGVRPDLNIKTTIANGIPGSVMPAWSQEKGGPLAEQDINDLVAFILSQPATSVVQAQSPAAAPEPATPSIFRGWLGVAVLLVLFALIVAGAIIIQRR